MTQRGGNRFPARPGGTTRCRDIWTIELLRCTHGYLFTHVCHTLIFYPLLVCRACGRTRTKGRSTFDPSTPRPFDGRRRDRVSFACPPARAARSAAPSLDPNPNPQKYAEILSVHTLSPAGVTVRRHRSGYNNRRLERGRKSDHVSSSSRSRCGVVCVQAQLFCSSASHRA